MKMRLKTIRNRNNLDFRDEGSSAGLDADRQLPEHPACHVKVVNQAVVEHTTYYRVKYNGGNSTSKV